MRKKCLSVFILILSVFILVGCSSIDNVRIKLGLKNDDFEYIKNGKVKKIVIQNIRDKNFKFIITDKVVIEDMYDILSKAKEVEKKSSLQPDYVFELHEKGEVVHRFNYVAGLDKHDDGNLYSGDKVYIVSKRIDNDIIINFFNVRKPVNFKNVYYGSIKKIIQEYSKEHKFDKLSIDVSKDKNGAKFILSTDLEDFKSELDKDFKNVFIDSKDSDTILKVETEGYKSDIFKAKYAFIQNDKAISEYYVIAKNTEFGWTIKVFEEKPDEF